MGTRSLGIGRTCRSLMLPGNGYWNPGGRGSRRAGLSGMRGSEGASPWRGEKMGLTNVFEGQADWSLVAPAPAFSSPPYEGGVRGGSGATGPRIAGGRTDPTPPNPPFVKGGTTKRNKTRTSSQPRQAQLFTAPTSPSHFRDRLSATRPSSIPARPRAGPRLDDASGMLMAGRGSKRAKPGGVRATTSKAKPERRQRRESGLTWEGRVSATENSSSRRVTRLSPS